MEVKKASTKYLRATGYKQTEVGVIPEDWEVKPLHLLADKIMVGIASAATHAYRDRGIVLFRNQNIKPGYLDDSDLLYIDEDYEETFRNKRLKAGDLLTARTGYPGTTSIVPKQYEGAQSFTTLITRPRSDVVDSEYLCIFINSEAGQTYFEQNQIGGGQKNVNASSLKNLPVAFPPTKAEQEAIAEALSDADALIESLEQLLAKKRHLKQGAMQQLLTGKKRLPGFSGEWDTVCLRDLLTYERPDRYIVQDTKYTERGQIPVLTANRSFILGYTDEDFGICRDIPVIVFDDFTTDNKYVEFPFKVKSSAIKLLRPKHDRVDLRYVFERTQLIRFPLGGHKRYYISEFQNLEFEIPAYDEQQAITAILSDMNAELAALEEKLAKARHLKQGMMQELLTGRIRLIENG